MLYSEEIGLERTDPKRWRLHITPLGRTTWEYLSKEDSEKSPQSEYVKYLLETGDFNGPKPDPTINTPLGKIKKGAEFFQLLQDPDSGIFPNQYKGPTFLTIGYLIAHYYAKIELPDGYKTELIRFIVNNSHPVDGGWGLHTEDKSTCFGTTLGYIALRMLGMPADHPVCVKARKTLHSLGGARKNPHWGKIWLAVLNVYKWEGVNPAPPELWAMPYALPLHPGRWWVHTRAIYLPVGIVQANRIQCEEDDLIRQLRTEIYLPNESYDTIDYENNRNNVCGVDLYYPHTKILDVANYFMSIYEKHRPKWMLNRMNKYSYDILVKEFENTEYLTIAPVSHAFAVIAACFMEGTEGKNFKKAFARANDSVFHGNQGMVVMGTNGSQTWDAAFTIQIFISSGLAELPQFQKTVERAYLYLVRNQFDTECREGSFREKRIGTWGFSTKEQGYTVSDCTSEALKSIIMVREHPAFSHLRDAIKDESLYDAVEIILGLQNVGSFEYGSFASYEKIKATTLLEHLNPAEVFNNIMVEYPYVECTDSSVLGLTYFHHAYPHYKPAKIEKTLQDAIDYILGAQDEDGSWYGSWGVCYTYAMMFALEALNSVDLDYLNSSAVRKACDFILSKQLPDGGWSESMKGCETHSYVNAEASQAVQTSWSLIALLMVGCPDHKAIKRGIKLLMDKQAPNGQWSYEGVEGQFNHSCGIEYPNYRYLFPLKALGLYIKHYGDEPIEN
ncbi:lanosterol synthase [Suhomyces tanzawaensis NRRL Y-17324]|uniref:Terpene cyclase/mutase family member n=1 Tax=Suhomyces tanzawaensis NRRL Y-17324 TaxID=984487 RepID=A0A1E4SF28_9ASCO|nr:lanosterol synthase [Suhomyces tanzawaensis NRRL Y-17324]ODV78076.1 lanosterol synthase [Suhomyces tanzawaensis NRRL Y-17324]